MRIGTLKETYVADAALFDSRTQKVWLAVGVPACAILLLTLGSGAATFWAWSPAFVVYCFGPGAVRVKEWMLDRKSVV